MLIPTLTTDRLTLRAPQGSDLSAYTDFRASDRASFVGGPFDAREAFHQMCGLAGHWQIRGYGRWMVADRDTDAPLGVVGLYFPVGWPEPELAWSVFADGEGRGIAHEAARAARTYAYDTVGLTTLISCVAPDNARSLALAERMGATPDGHFEHAVYGTMHIWRHPGPGGAR